METTFGGPGLSCYKPIRTAHGCRCRDRRRRGLPGQPSDAGQHYGRPGRTFFAGEKWHYPPTYYSSAEAGDDNTMFEGHDHDIVRWCGINCPPVRDMSRGLHHQRQQLLVSPTTIPSAPPCRRGRLRLLRRQRAFDLYQINLTIYQYLGCRHDGRSTRTTRMRASREENVRRKGMQADRQERRSEAMRERAERRHATSSLLLHACGAWIFCAGCSEASPVAEDAALGSRGHCPRGHAPIRRQRRRQTRCQGIGGGPPSRRNAPHDQGARRRPRRFAHGRRHRGPRRGLEARPACCSAANRSPWTASDWPAPW